MDLSFDPNALVPDAPDLSRKAVMSFIGTYPAPIRDALNRMDLREPWVADLDPAVEQALVDLGESLGVEGLRDLRDHPSEDLLLVLGYVSAARCLTIVHHIMDSTDDSAWVDLLSRAAEIRRSSPSADVAYRILAGRVAHITQSRTWHRIFSPTRSDRIILALNELTLST